MSNGSTGPVERHHPGLDALIAPDSSLEVVADMSGHEGPHWLESPTWDSRSGSLLFLDVTETPGVGGPDGLEVDHLGNLYAAGREAVFVLAADGTHLGTIRIGAITTNLGWSENGSTLFITTERRRLRLRVRIGGLRFE